MSMADQILKRIEAASVERKRIEIPEWGVPAQDDKPAEPLVVYSTPLSIADQRIVGKQGGGDHFLTCVYMVIKKITDAEGTPIFTAEHKEALCRGQRDVILRVAGEISSHTGLESAIKN